MPVKVTRSGKRPQFDGKRAAELVAGYVPGAIIKRTGDGIDMDGNPFAPYTPGYLEALRIGGEDVRVDLRLTGGLMNSIKVRGRTVRQRSVSVIVAPDGGTSPAVYPRAGKMVRSGDRGPPHNALGYWIHHGTARMRPRRFMGLTRAQAKTLLQLLQKAKLFG